MGQASEAPAQSLPDYGWTVLMPWDKCPDYEWHAIIVTSAGDVHQHGYGKSYSNARAQAETAILRMVEAQ